MKIKKLIYRIKPPCSKCPYKQGVIKTLVNPCPQCKANGYQAFEWLQGEVTGIYSASSNKDK